MSVDFFEIILNYIEQNLHKKIVIQNIAKLAGLSTVHMNRLFKFAYGMTIAEYIRKRKLSESLSDLLQENNSVLEIALFYGFEYEQSFTRAFKAEFGITPGQYRKNRPIIKITPPIHNFGVICADGLLFGPEIVMFPKIYLIGVEQNVPYRNSTKLAPKAALDFWDKRRHEIKNSKNSEIFYGLTHHFDYACKYTRYLTAVEVNDIGEIPIGMTSDIFGDSLCVKFHYIGKHHYRELSQKTAKKMYNTIEKYFHESKNISYINTKIHLEKIDSAAFSGKYCLLEWFVPII